MQNWEEWQTTPEGCAEVPQQADRMSRQEQKQALFSGAQCRDKRPWAPAETREVLSQHQEALLCSVSDGAWAQVTHRGCGVSKSFLDLVLGNLLWMALL